MAIWRHTLGQSAVKAASELVSAKVEAGVLEPDQIDEEFERVRDENFAYLDGLADQDDEAYASKSEDAKPARKSSAKRSTSKTSNKRSGGSKSKGRGSSITLEDAQEMELSFGAFEGVSLADLAEIDAETADEEYNYGDGERDGRDYLSWLAGSTQKNEFVQRRAVLVCDDLGIDYE